MFGGSFGQIRFGLRAGNDLIVPVRMMMLEQVGSLVTVGKDMPMVTGSISFSERFSGTAVAAIAVPFAMALREDILADARINADIIFGLHASEIVDGTATAVENIYIRQGLREELHSSAYLSKNIYVSILLHDALQAATQAVKDIYHAMTVSEVLGCTVSPAVLDRETAIISVTIPAGSTLTIDSENYEVYLDGQPILHLQSGDWIILNRELVDLMVDSGTGGELSGTVLYRERYL
jgi:hypothetical protein